MRGPAKGRSRRAAKLAVLYGSLQKRKITTFSKNHQKTKILILARMRAAAKGRSRRGAKLAVLYSSLQKHKITTFSKNHQKTKIPILARMRGAARTQKKRVPEEGEIGRVIGIFHFLHAL